MEMHAGGQTKNVPFRRIIHAIQEAICPLTHRDVDVHEECIWLFIYPTPGNPGRTLRVSRDLRLISLISSLPIPHDPVINDNSIFPGF